MSRMGKMGPTSAVGSGGRDMRLPQTAHLLHTSPEESGQSRLAQHGRVLSMQDAWSLYSSEPRLSSSLPQEGWRDLLNALCIDLLSDQHFCLCPSFGAFEDCVGSVSPERHDK